MKPPARELEILLAIAEGNSVECTAQKLTLSSQGVREVLVRVRERYGVPNNEAAIAVALGQNDIVVSSLNGHLNLEDFEIDLLDRIALGQEDKTLTAELFLHRSVIDKQVGVALAKLGAVNRVNGVYLAFRYGLLTGFRERQIRRARQSEIRALTAVAQATDIEEAATVLELSPLSVKGYVERARRRLGTNNTPHAVYVAIRRKEMDCPRVAPTTASLLSVRERYAIHLMATGLENQEIATKLEVTLRTANRIIPEAIHKLGAKSRAHAVYMFFQQGVLH